MKRFVSLTACGTFLAMAALGAESAGADRLPELQKELKARCGIAVVVGSRASQWARALADETPLQVVGVLAKWSDVEKARRDAANDGIPLAKLTWVLGSPSRLPLADRLVNLVIATDDDMQVTEEMRRIVQPRGRIVVGEHAEVMPVPDDIDDWTHPYYAPDNNPASHDRAIRAPYLTQFLADPRYAPAPQFTVAAGGRVFKIFGHVAWHEREEPYLNVIVAYDGFNGTQLWRYPLPEGMMVHRNVFVATPEVLYVGDHESCKRIDATTGKVIDEIRAPADLVDGPFWKWMALRNGILYALVGEKEFPARPVKWKRKQHGWPWNQISPGFNRPEQPWGFGRTLLAFDLKTKKVLWHHRESEPIDARAVCMNDDRLFAFRFGSFLTCLDAASGKVLWRKDKETDAALFETLGEYLPRQSWRTNWRTVVYLKCSNDALYFAGPQLSKLVVLSTSDGRVLWEDPYDNYQLIIRPDALYAISGPWGVEKSKKFDPLTGKVLAELPIGRRACTRPTATSDSILFRAMGGSVRLDLAAGQPRWISPMRPACHDGVTIANGLLYWWPYVCDCQLSLNGVTALTSAGDFDFAPAPDAPGRLVTSKTARQIGPEATELDWPTFRANAERTAVSKARIPERAAVLWTTKTASPTERLTPPIAIGRAIYVAGTDGIVHRLDAATGALEGAYPTGGEIKIAPSYWKGRVFVGSGDGWVYALSQDLNSVVWRYQAAPAQRSIPVYGKLLSTWPAGSGVLVHEDIAYVAAGRVNYDGTYVYALDAATGRPIWCNDDSGFLDPEARTGVSVMGHLLLHKNRLYLAGGNAVSPAVYDVDSGKCLNDPEPLRRCESTAPRGWELFLVGDKVVACGKPFYSRPELPVYDHTVEKKILHARSGDRDVVWLDNRVLAGFDSIPTKELNACVANRKVPRHITQAWGKFRVSQKPKWRFDCPESVAVAVTSNAVLVADRVKLTALRLADGSRMWQVKLPAAPVPWGLAVTSDGTAIMTLENGQTLAVGRKD